MYSGGKIIIGSKISKVLKALEQALYISKRPYLEPFMGCLGVLKHMTSDREHVIGCDINKDIISLFTALQVGWQPPVECSKEEWERLKASPISTAEKGFLGISCSWNGSPFYWYRFKTKEEERKALEKSKQKFLELKEAIENVTFMHSSYISLNPKDFLIYCDPPYINNHVGKPDGLFRTFEHAPFWEKMREWSKTNLVVISEWEAPEDFVKIWGTERFISSGKGRKAKKFMDNLYIHQDTYNKLTKEVLDEIKNI